MAAIVEQVDSESTGSIGLSRTAQDAVSGNRVALFAIFANLVFALKF